MAGQCSIGEVIPAPQQNGLLFTHQHDDTRQFAARKAAAVLEPDRIQPNLGPIRIPLHVNVCGLSAVTGEKEASVWTDTENGAHLRNLSSRRVQRIAEPLPHNEDVG